MEIYLETRDRPRQRDYRFLGRNPGGSWWRERYHDLTAFEYKTILLESGPDGWRAWVGAIASTRRDEVETVIRWNLVFTGGHQEADREDRDLVLALVDTRLGELAAPGGTVSACGGALDAAISKQDVDQWYDAEPEQIATLVGEQVRTALRTLERARNEGAGQAPPAPPAGQAAAAGAVVSTTAAEAKAAASRDAGGDAGRTARLPRAWIGALGNPRARTAFVDSARRLLEGAAGRALLVNLVEGSDRVPSAPGELVAVLSLDDENQLGREIKALTVGPTSPDAGSPAGSAAGSGSATTTTTTTTAIQRGGEGGSGRSGGNPDTVGAAPAERDTGKQRKGSGEGEAKADTAGRPAGLVEFVLNMRYIKFPDVRWQVRDLQTPSLLSASARGYGSSVRDPGERVPAEASLVIDVERADRHGIPIPILQDLVDWWTHSGEAAGAAGGSYTCRRLVKLEIHCGNETFLFVPSGGQSSRDGKIVFTVHRSVPGQPNPVSRQATLTIDGIRIEP